MVTSVLEESVASIFRAEEQETSNNQAAVCFDSQDRGDTSVRAHDITTQKFAVFTVTSVRNLKLTITKAAP
jgi:hypothetical protein